jgi:uncharacterized membrane protein (UPF0127 family)
LNVRRFEGMRSLHVRPAQGGGLWVHLCVHVAAKFRHRLIGLAGLRELQGVHGLLIPACGCVHTVGMRFPIDVVFVAFGGDSLTVLEVHASVPPLRIVRASAAVRGVPALAALELAAGEARRLGG